MIIKLYFNLRIANSNTIEKSLVNFLVKTNQIIMQKFLWIVKIQVCD